MNLFNFEDPEFNPIRFQNLEDTKKFKELEKKLFQHLRKSLIGFWTLVFLCSLCYSVFFYVYFQLEVQEIKTFSLVLILFISFFSLMKFIIHMDFEDKYQQLILTYENRYLDNEISKEISKNRDK